MAKHDTGGTLILPGFYRNSLLSGGPGPHGDPPWSLLIDIEPGSRQQNASYGGQLTLSPICDMKNFIVVIPALY